MGETHGWLKIQHIILQKPSNKKKKPSVILHFGTRPPPHEALRISARSSDSNATEEAPQSELMGAGNK
jgi:hypothetical protein